uniref:Alpha-amylase/branching enzyme C-terminal all beta domain-containing protein n=1 Tax=Hemiselmis andersenii TaxID=464988 RepID=A0A7S0Y3Y8_HEMAN
MWWAAAACGVASGVPMLFQGTEILQPGWWHTDQYFRWDLAPENGLGTEGGSAPAIEMMKLVKATLDLRKEHPDVCGHDPQVVHQDEKNMVYGVRRQGYLSVLHAGGGQWGDGEDRYEVKCGGGSKAKQVFNSMAEELGGWDASWTVKGDKEIKIENGGLRMKLPKWSVLVFKIS